MIWDDKAFLLSKNRYSENSLIAEFFTKNHGKIPGIIFGGSSKKIKNYLQIGNQLFVNYNSKSETRIGYFKIEILKAYSPIYFDQSKKLSCITSAMSLIRLLTVDSQSNTKVYDLINEFYLILSDEEWLKKYIFWELKLLSNLGYNLNLPEMVNKKMINNKILYVAESSNEKKIIPKFLIEQDEFVHDINILLDGLKLVGDFMDKTILKPNNINFPISRNQFVNSLK
tara:strand:+ start:787 stop:1467 length:681 start_codon:yes stop_codon:yes gene_type:complete